MTGGGDKDKDKDKIDHKKQAYALLRLKISL